MMAKGGTAVAIENGTAAAWTEELLDPATLFIAQQAAVAAGLSVEAWLERAIRKTCGDIDLATEADPTKTPLPRGRAIMIRGWLRSHRRTIALTLPPLVIVAGAAAALLAQRPSPSGVAVALAPGRTTVTEVAIPLPQNEAPKSAAADLSSDQGPSDPAQLAAWLEPRAKAGDAIAQYRLGALYALGKGVDKDFTQAASLLEAAAKSGLAEAQYDFAILTQAGLGVARDPEEAATWYLRAAMQGHAEAALNLGYAYAKGLGVKTDMAAAAQWFRRAAEHGVINAQYNLAFLYETGDGVPRSPVEAFAWYSAAGKKGDLGAQQAADRLARGFSAKQLKEATARAAEIAGSVSKTSG
ncbi:MAG TPA: tetratricopeptide repeat protein [Stellaceae bacterium]|nr:tetratricopeptide repeat protein [Stellaceae bacterium]